MRFEEWLCPSLHRHKLHTHRSIYLERLPGRRELSGCLVDAKDDDVVRLLVCRQQKISARIDVKAAWNLALGRSVVDRCERPSLRVDGENRNAVVAAIGGVKELA